MSYNRPTITKPLRTIKAAGIKDYQFFSAVYKLGYKFTRSCSMKWAISILPKQIVTEAYYICIGRV